MLDASIVHFMQSLSTAITPWLVGSAVGFLMLWLILLFGQMNAFAKPSAWFSALTPLKKSFFKAAGCEVVTAEYGGFTSPKRQIMNQADIFYYSGHGHHDSNDLVAAPYHNMILEFIR